ncbi:relaxase/mobilization nuclease domain-containing protein [Actinomadura gamaensis]|uniref:Relaxase/mobilization nuclease domain-containing protein n=1 Tax=Actinomadura gamaensis TaxID=1763541 RepID=A0ABV9TTR0_9ACTN
MIGKVRRGSRVEGLLRYLFGPGNDGEHRDAYIVTGFRSVDELEPLRRPDETRDLRRLDALLTQPMKLLGERNYRKPVWHLSLRAAPEDPILTDQQWARIAVQMMDRVGLAPDGDPDAVRWIAVRHADDHIHLVATLARQDGVRPDVWNDARFIRAGCREVEDELGLRRTAPADRTAARRATRGEQEKARREGRAEDPRSALRRTVQEAAAAARTESEFYDLLRRAGVLVRQRHSQHNPDQVTGYAVALPEYRTAAGPAVWYGGGKLAADLTLPKLRARWTEAGPPVSGRGLDERTVRAYLRTAVRQAADQARTAAEFLGHLEAAGIMVRTRESVRNPQQLTGYAVALPDHRDAQGRPAWYTSGKLAADLSWTQLVRAWQHEPSPVPRALALSADERRAVYEDAARAAAFASAEIRRHTVTRPHAARDACWATADVLRSAARATGNNHLRNAADAYDRAARAPFGRPPAPTPSGNRLRAIARVLAITRSGDSVALQLISTLALALLALVEAITDLHRLQNRQAQAGATRAASAHLHQINSEEHPWLSKDQPMPEPVALAMADVPTPWAPPAFAAPPSAPLASRPKKDQQPRHVL